MNLIAVIANFFIPGVGSFLVGQAASGVAQLLIFCIGAFLSVTVILLPIGLALMAIAWIWGLMTAAMCSRKPQEVVLVGEAD